MAVETPHGYDELVGNDGPDIEEAQLVPGLGRLGHPTGIEVGGEVPPPDWFTREACVIMILIDQKWIYRPTYLWLGLAPLLISVPQFTALLWTGEGCVHEKEMTRLYHAVATFLFCLPWPFLFHGLRKVAHESRSKGARRALESRSKGKPTRDGDDRTMVMTEGCDQDDDSVEPPRTLTVDAKSTAQLTVSQLRVMASFSRGHDARVKRIHGTTHERTEEIVEKEEGQEREEALQEGRGSCCFSCVWPEDTPGALEALRDSEWGIVCDKEQADRVFTLFDKNKDGKINAEELRQTLEHLDEHATPPTLEQCQKMMKCDDKDEDGYIDREEFFDMVRADPKEKMISRIARNSLGCQAMMVTLLGSLMLGISGYIGFGLIEIISNSDQSNIDAILEKQLEPARGVLDHFLPDDGCISDDLIVIFEWVLVLGPIPAAVIASFVVPAWLLSLHLGVALAADCVDDIIRKLRPQPFKQTDADDGLLAKQFTDEATWEKEVQHPVAMLVETMRHLSDWGTAMGAAVVSYFMFAITMLPTAVATKSPWWKPVVWFALLVFFAIPFYLAWGPATVSSACDDLLDQLNDLSFLGTRQHRERVRRLRESLVNLQRGQGLGFQIYGTVVDKRMLGKVFLAGSGSTVTLITTVLTYAARDEDKDADIGIMNDTQI